MPTTAYRAIKSNTEENQEKSAYRKANVGFIVSAPSSYSNNSLLTGLYLCGCIASKKKHNLTLFCFHGNKIVTPDLIRKWKKDKEVARKVVPQKAKDILDIDESDDETKIDELRKSCSGASVTSFSASTCKDNEEVLKNFLGVPLPLKIEQKDRKRSFFSSKQIVTEIDEENKDFSLTLGGKEEALKDQDFLICVLDARDTDACAKLIKDKCGLGGPRQKREHGIYSLVREVRVGRDFVSSFDTLRHVAAIEGTSGIEVSLNKTKGGALSLVYPKGSLCIKRISRENQKIGINLANVIEDSGIRCLYDRSFSTFTWGTITPIYLGVTNALTGDMTMYDCMMKLENRRVIAAGLREFRLCMESISTDKKWLPRSSASLNLSLYWLELLFVLPNFFFYILYCLGISPVFSENVPSIIQQDLTDQNEYHPREDKYLTYTKAIFSDIEKVGQGQGIATPVTSLFKQTIMEVAEKKEGITRSVYYQKSDKLLEDIGKHVGPIKMRRSIWEVRKQVLRWLCILSILSVIVYVFL